MRKKRNFIAVFIIAILAVCGYFTAQKAGVPVFAPEDAAFSVTFLDVGQADCAYVTAGGENMLIDAGNNEDKDAVLGFLNEQGVTRLDYVVATHPHEDHIGAMSYVVDSFEVGNFIMPKKAANTKTFERLLDALERNNVAVTAPKAGDRFSVGDAACTILSGGEKNYDDTNDYSVVLRVDFYNNSFLFCGDASSLVEEEILSSGQKVSCDVLKTGHHGSRTASSQAFLDAARPRFAVISCGEGNSYGHPHAETLEKLAGRGVTVYRTDLCGSVQAAGDGTNVSWKTQKEAKKAR